MYDGKIWHEFSFEDMGVKSTMSKKQVIYSIFEVNDTVFFNYVAIAANSGTTAYYGGNFYKTNTIPIKYIFKESIDCSFTNDNRSFFNKESGKNYDVKQEKIEDWFSNKLDTANIIRYQTYLDKISKERVDNLFTDKGKVDVLGIMTDMQNEDYKITAAKIFDIKMSTFLWEYQKTPILCDEIKTLTEYEDIHKIICEDLSFCLLVLKQNTKDATTNPDDILVKMSNHDYVNSNLLVHKDKYGKTWFAIGKALCHIN
jgi:hypothetical protein